MVYFESNRLRFRDWQQDDFAIFEEMNADIEVMKYFPSTLTPNESKAFLKKIKEEFAERGYGLYAVELKETRDFIGYVGFHLSTFEADFTPCVEIGWRLRKEFWGKGYATEGAKACLKYGFDVLNFEKVYSFTAKINTPSENVMKRIGLKYVKDFEHPKAGDKRLFSHVLYQMEKDDFYKCIEGGN